MFISGGENIQPEEIEQRLHRFPGILYAVVVPVENKEFGHRPVAFLATESNTLPGEDILRQYLAEHLPRFKIPDYFFPMPSESDSPGIKISRQTLKWIAEEKVKEDR